MAGDWTKIEHALPDKPEVIAMSLRLSIEVDLVVGKLLRLWRWVDVHADIRANLDGHVHGVDNGWIDAHVRQDGFADALRFVKWLRNKRGGIIFPKIGKHLGEGAKARAGEAVRKRMQRGKCPDKCPDVRPDQRREEKRIEEKSATEAVACARSRRRSICSQKQALHIYSAYPRKQAREAALKAIIKAAARLAAEDNGNPVCLLMDATEAYAASPAGQPVPKGTDDFRPHPATWFNSGGYLDDRTCWQRANGMTHEPVSESIADRMKNLEVTRD